MRALVLLTRKTQKEHIHATGRGARPVNREKEI